MLGTLPRSLDLLRAALLPDGRLVDVAIADGTVTRVAAVGTLHASPERTLDLDGRLLLTAPAEPHAHLDKALSADVIRPPLGDLGSAIAAWAEHAATMTVEDIADRARAQALAMLAAGTTAVRTHVDVLSGHGDATVDEATRGARALVQVRAELAGLMDLELVALAGPHAPDEHVEAVLDLGVDLVGGAPHLADDPNADVDRLLAIARRRGLGVDLHADESLDGPVTLDHYARSVRDWPRDRQYSAGHCVRLGTLQPGRLAEVVADVLAADVGVITLPITNLYLQGWQHPVATPRGLTTLRALLDAGVRVAAGADNVRDPFNPVGRSDAFETASLLVTAGHLTPDEAYGLVSDGARSVMGLPAAGAVPGARADFVAVDATGVTDAIANAPAGRLVVAAGRLVAATEVQRTVAAPNPVPSRGTAPASENTPRSAPAHENTR
ncbi:amidohydrolase family protein [Curtobacterium pusillum]|uniref:Amidohydrolase family protein n=1 Tax=Curtobacterium pusillum TaxID=69373 RepID=A0ABX2MHR8_9MICO|nr:amidohydrolase family protein [Curtobacterium pusillum]NUU15096.1 amidohydrolase family protein [Curtobacterium pusillum]GLK31578.1 cytosine deaminase [Curtobacterium pusillum]